MDRRLKNRQYGYLDAGNDRVRVNMLQGQQISGYSVGIVHIEQVFYPVVPGNVVNGYTFDFPVRMRAVPGLEQHHVFESDPAVADKIIELGQHMIRYEGIRALSSACGFFGNFQQTVSAALDIPVALSSLIQLPLIKSTIKPHQKVGVLTANAGAMTDSLLTACSIHDRNDMVVRDLRHAPEFSAILECRGEFDNGIAEDEVVTAALSLFEEDAEIGAILLECSDMPPYAAAVQRATQLPVFDFVTLIKWLHNAAHQTPYRGFI